MTTGRAARKGLAFSFRPCWIFATIPLHLIVSPALGAHREHRRLHDAFQRAALSGVIGEPEGPFPAITTTCGCVGASPLEKHLG